jgi:hypothetical protein
MPIHTSNHSHPVTQTLKAVSYTPTAVGAATTVEQTVTVPGVKIGDMVQVTPPGHVAGVALGSARVAVANVVRVTWVNATAGPVTPPAGTYKFLVLR